MVFSNNNSITISTAQQALSEVHSSAYHLILHKVKKFHIPYTMPTLVDS